MSDKSLKVTDRRMFTPDGELREEFSHLQEVPADASRPAPEPRATPDPVDSPPAGRPGPDRPDAARPGHDRPPATEPPASDGRRPSAPGRGAPGRGAPGFFDLVGLLAEPAAHYMQEAHAAPPQTASQSLALARLHIDLLAVLKEKTEGNLTPEEKAMLDDVVYQLRSGFVGLGG